MDDTEKRARKILAETYRKCGEWEVADKVENGADLDRSDEMVTLPAIISALSPQWQPIETAPKDRTKIVGVDHPSPDYEEYEVGIYHFYKGEWWPNSGPPIAITHWMPMPQPPEIK